LFGIEEVLLISVIVLVVFGPDKLPEVARVLGMVTKEFRKVTSTAQRTWGEISQEIDLQDAQARAKLLEEKRRAAEELEVGTGQPEGAGVQPGADTVLSDHELNPSVVLDTRPSDVPLSAGAKTLLGLNGMSRLPLRKLWRVMNRVLRFKGREERYELET